MLRCPEFFNFAKKMENGQISDGLLGKRRNCETSGAEIILFGIPYEGSISSRRGTSEGPGYLRGSHFSFSASSDPDLDIDIDEGVNVIDYGDFYVDLFNMEKSLKLIQDQMSKLLEGTATPISVSGDQAALLPQLRALALKYGRLALVHFGATLNAETLQAIEEGLIDPSFSIEVGTRNGFADKKGTNAKQAGLRFLMANALHYMDLKEAASVIRKCISDKPVFVSYDMNFLDPAYAPGVGNPVSGGFSVYDTQQLLESSMADTNVVGLELTDILPAKDINEVTVNDASEVLHKLLSVAAFNIMSKKDKQEKQ